MTICFRGFNVREDFFSGRKIFRGDNVSGSSSSLSPKAIVRNCTYFRWNMFPRKVSWIWSVNMYNFLAFPCSCPTPLPRKTGTNKLTKTRQITTRTNTQIWNWLSSNFWLVSLQWRAWRSRKGLLGWQEIQKVITARVWPKIILLSRILIHLHIPRIRTFLIIQHKKSETTI